MCEREHVLPTCFWNHVFSYFQLCETTARWNSGRLRRWANLQENLLEIRNNLTITEKNPLPGNNFDPTEKNQLPPSSKHSEIQTKYENIHTARNFWEIIEGTVKKTNTENVKYTVKNLHPQEKSIAPRKIFPDFQNITVSSSKPSKNPPMSTVSFSIAVLSPDDLKGEHFY